MLSSVDHALTAATTITMRIVFYHTVSTGMKAVFRHILLAQGHVFYYIPLLRSELEDRFDVLRKNVP